MSEEKKPPRTWTVAIEGIVVGKAVGDDPKAAIESALITSGIRSLAEGIEMKVFDEKESWILFASEGHVYLATPAQFEQVRKSSQWVGSVTKNRVQREAALRDLRSLFAAGGAK